VPARHARVKSQLTLQSQRKVLSLLEGEFASLHIGAGTDFHDLREYVRGDDVQDVDWKASARTGDLLVKRFSAVRKHTVLLVISTGRSMAAMHTFDRSKRDLAVEVAGLIGWLAVRQDDLVAVVGGDADTQWALPPRAGELHLERGLDMAHAAAHPSTPAADTAALLRHVARTQRRRAIVIVVSDDVDATPDLQAALRRAAVQHDVLMVTVEDLDPATVPVGAPGCSDVDSGWRLPAWVREDAQLSLELAAVRTEQRRRFHDKLALLGVVHAHLEPGTSPLSLVRGLLHRHRHARRR
jgi:uncharacterized protein (DUF58 family)